MNKQTEKKNTVLKTGVTVMAAALMTTSFMGYTLARYKTEASGAEVVRVAKWEIDADSSMSLSMSDLFKTSYANGAASANNDDIMAPGTSGSATLTFTAPQTAPEVAYTLSLSMEADGDIFDEHHALTWTFTQGDSTTEFDSWSDLEEYVNAVSMDFDANKKSDYTCTIGWEWDLDAESDKEARNEADTALALENLSATTLTLTMSAQQKS